MQDNRRIDERLAVQVKYNFVYSIYIKIHNLLVTGKEE